MCSPVNVTVLVVSVEPGAGEAIDGMSTFIVYCWSVVCHLLANFVQ